jgi:hypothetical protein
VIRAKGVCGKCSAEYSYTVLVGGCDVYVDAVKCYCGEWLE